MNRPHSAQPSDEQRQLIKDLGGATAVADIIKRRTGHEIAPQACSNWLRRGIPYRYRGVLVVEAREKSINVPADFFGIGQGVA